MELGDLPYTKTQARRICLVAILAIMELGDLQLMLDFAWKIQ